MRTSGDLTSASAMPSRWRMPREYVSTAVVGAVGQADLVEHLVDRGLGLRALSRPLSRAV